MSTVAPARVAAFDVVRRTLEGGAYADRALRSASRGLSARDRSLAKQLAFGTVQRRGTLDWAATELGAKHLEPRVRAALHLGLYQLVYLDGIAAHAALGEAVELAKPSAGHKVVNAILRRVQREGLDVPSDETPAGAAPQHAHPRWIVDCWWDWLGPEETRALLAANNRPAELALRLNTLRPPATELPPGRHAEGDAYVVEGPFDVVGSPLFAAGALTPQSRAAQLVSTTLGPQPGERVLDLCAAPGGKTTHLAALMGDRGEIVAVERHGGRARELAETCARMGASIVSVVNEDALSFSPGRPFDRVLLDPPCSGLGTLRTHPDLRWRVTEARAEVLAGEQRALLETARRALKAGGRLTYSVCTLHPPEELLGDVGDSVRTFPHRDDTDGFYIGSVTADAP